MPGGARHPPGTRRPPQTAVADRHRQRGAGDELGRIDADLVEAAAVARAVDARLLAAVLPVRATRAANERLAVSRAAYFRYLRRARERVARTLVEALPPGVAW